MSILKLANNDGNHIDTLYEKLEYILRLSAADPRYVMSIGTNLEDAFCFMNLSKERWGKTYGKAYLHCILSPDSGTMERVGVKAMYAAGCEVAEFLSSYQGTHYIVMAMHFDSEIPHFHYIIDNIDWTNGKRMSIGLKELWEIKDKISRILTANNIPPLLMYRKEIAASA